MGTSEFLSDLQIHIGDLVYVTKDVGLKQNPNENEITLIKIPQYYDIKLLEILDDWIKVEFEENVGYIKKSEITSVLIIVKYQVNLILIWI